MTEDKHAGSDNESIPMDWPLLSAEITSVFLAILSAGLIYAGIGFFSVYPPGEEELCRGETLGVADKDEQGQNAALRACHGLYLGVFDMLSVIGGVHLAVGFLAAISVFAVLCGIFHAGRRNKDHAHRSFCCAAVGDIAATVVAIVPMLVFPGVAAAVSAGMVPIHAYYTTMSVAHASITTASKVSGVAGSDAEQSAEWVYNTLKKGYFAVCKVEVSLNLGAACLLCLPWVYIFDFIRNILLLTCWKPNYEKVDGLQVLRPYKNWKRAAAAKKDSEKATLTAVE